MVIALDPSLFCKNVGVVIALDPLPLLEKGRGGHGSRRHPRSSGKKVEVVMALYTFPLLEKWRTRSRSGDVAMLGPSPRLERRRTISTNPRPASTQPPAQPQPTNASPEPCPNSAPAQPQVKIRVPTREKANYKIHLVPRCHMIERGIGSIL